MHSFVVGEQSALIDDSLIVAFVQNKLCVGISIVKIRNQRPLLGGQGGYLSLSFETDL